MRRYDHVLRNDEDNSRDGGMNVGHLEFQGEGIVG